MFDFENTIMH